MNKVYSVSVFSLLKKPPLIFLTTSCKLTARMDILILGFNVSLIVNFGLSFWNVSFNLAWCNLTNFHPSKTSRSFQAVFRKILFFKGFSSAL